MNVDIYLRERSGKREIRIPLLPEKILCNIGDTSFCSYDIMNKGEVAIPTGVALSTYSWSSEFPGKYRTDKAMMRGDWQEPATYHNTLLDWQRNGTRLTLLVTGYPINADVYIEKYQAEASGGFGDMAYEISFKGERNVTVATTQTPEPKRAAVKTTKYTIKRGDTLWGISQRFLGKGSKWQTIYDANASIIEQTARKYGQSSSNHGWWIYPGVTLTIPQ